MTGRVITDLAQLPRTADSWTFLYAERTRVERADYAIELRDQNGRVQVPIAAISTLLLGPGTTITHAAILSLAESGCSIVWCGEGASRFYASGLGETRRAHHLEAQATVWAIKEKHLETVRRLYEMRFPEGLPDDLTLEQIRGHEGVRVREAYARIARETGITWSGRSYRRDDWSSADPVNRALSAANACLYGVCHAAIVATGFSSGLGFLHIGKQLSFVYDIADLYKVDVTVPAAFRAAKDGGANLESRVRRNCRDLFLSTRLLERIVPDLQRVVGLAPQKARLFVHEGASDAEEGLGAEPGALWNEDGTRTDGARNFAHADGSSMTGPSIAKTVPPEPAEGDAYEGDIDFALASSGDDLEPF